MPCGLPAIKKCPNNPRITLSQRKLGVCLHLSGQVAWEEVVLPYTVSSATQLPPGDMGQHGFTLLQLLPSAGHAPACTPGQGSLIWHSTAPCSSALALPFAAATATFAHPALTWSHGPLQFLQHSGACSSPGRGPCPLLPCTLFRTVLSAEQLDTEGSSP